MASKAKENTRGFAWPHCPGFQFHPEFLENLLLFCLLSGTRRSCFL